MLDDDNSLDAMLFSDLYASVLSVLPIALVAARVSHKKAIIGYVSPHFSELVSIEQSALIGQDYVDFFSSQSDVLLKSLLMDAMTRRESKSFNLCLGNPIYLLIECGLMSTCVMWMLTVSYICSRCIMTSPT
jgi:hypothetical protein